MSMSVRGALRRKSAGPLLHRKGADPAPSDPAPSELKAVIAELGKAFAEFRATNDARLGKLEKGGVAPDLDEKLGRINDELSRLSALKSALDDLEKKANRPGMTSSKEVKEHREAFDRFLRKGDEARLGELQSKALSVGSDTDGGYAVPEELDRQIIAVERDQVVMREICRVITVGSEDYKKLVSVGGTGAGWVGETDARPETTTSKLEALTPYFGELYANPAATQKMLDDAFFNAEQWLAEEVALEFAEREDEAFTAGDGVNKPKGLLAYTLATTADGTRAFGQIQVKDSGSAGAFDGDDLIDVIHALKRGYRRNARWLLSNLTVAAARKLKDVDGNYLWRPGLEAGTPDLLLGYPIAENDQMPDPAADAVAVAFGDFQRAYYILDRLGTRVLRDPYTHKPYIHFYTTKRVGGMLADDRAVKLLRLKA